jgi:hypothetical protein
VESIFKDIQSFVPKNSKLLHIKKKIDIEEDGGNVKWKNLQDIYDKVNRSGSTDKIPYMLVSFINSIFCQERIFFTMDLESFKDKIWNKDENFKNWKEKDRKGFRATTWTKFKKYLREQGYVKVLNLDEETGRSTDNKALMYEIIHPNLLGLLNIDKEKQYQETKAWINGDTNASYDGNHGGNHGGNQAISNKSKGINTNHNQGQDNYDLEITMSLLFKGEFGIDKRTHWSEINDQIELLASYAVENLGVDDCTRRDFLNYLLELNNGKKFETKPNKYTKWSQKQFAELLADNFEESVKLHVYNAKKENKQLEIVEPQEIVRENKPTQKMTKEERKKMREQAGQQETVKILKADFANPALEALERQFQKATDDHTREMILEEIKMIRMVCYGD